MILHRVIYNIVLALTIMTYYLLGIQSAYYGKTAFTIFCVANIFIMVYANIEKKKMLIEKSKTLNSAPIIKVE